MTSSKRNFSPHIWLLSGISALLISGIVILSNKKDDVKIETLFGSCKVEEPLIKDLLNSHAMNRLKKIDQHGIDAYLHQSPTFDRYSHSISVYHLLKMYGASLEERAAGLLHDVSHTVFSHLIEMVVSHEDFHWSYQDNIHEWFLNQEKIPEIVNKYKLSISDIIHHKGDFLALEQPLPDMCADRIEYNLHTGYVFGLINQKDIHEILNDLHFKNGLWYFEDPLIAKKFALISLYMTENFWGSPGKCVLSRWAAEAIKRALAIELINKDEIHFSTDDIILQKLLTSTDPVIKEMMERCQSYKDTYAMGTPSDHNWHVRMKFRGIDPWIYHNGSYQRLTKLDSAFASEFERVRAVMKEGWFINLLEKESPL